MILVFRGLPRACWDFFLYHDLDFGLWSRTLTEALRNSGASPDVSRRREADTDYRDAPPTPPPVVCVRAANVRARAYAHGHVCVRARA